MAESESRLDSWGREIHPGGFVKEFVKANLKPSKELSYVLGVIEGDGCIYTNPDNWCYRVKLQVTDKCFAETFQESLKKIGLNPHLFTKKRDSTRKRTFTVVAYSAHFVKWYRKKNLDNLRKIVQNFKEDFIRGIYDSEGSLDIRERENRTFPQVRVLIVNTNKKLLRIVKSMLDDMGIFSRFVTKSPASEWRDEPLWGIRVYSCTDAIEFLKRINPSIEKNSYSRLEKKIGDRKPKEFGIYSKKTYEKAMKMRRDYGWGSLKISRELEIPQSTVGGWIYKGKTPYSAKGGGDISSL